MTGVLLWLVLSASSPPPDGALCTLHAPDFDQVAYGVPRCRRRVTTSMRRAVFARHRISWEQRGLYELDHWIPLCLGGSNDLANLYPQPWPAARRKDVLENRLCRLLREGKIKQGDAVAQVRAWR